MRELFKKHRTMLGVVASTAWICVMGVMLIQNEHPLELNEWGDTFAGFFAPLAFLWLVLGYLQQGEELRLQAEELRKSVEHQGELAKIGKEQLSNELQRMRDQEMQKRIDARPDIRVSFNGTTTDSLGTKIKVLLQNKGGSIRVVSLEGRNIQLLSQGKHRLDEEEIWPLTFAPGEGSDTITSPPVMHLHYVDRLGNQGFAVWEPTYNLQGSVEDGSFIPFEGD